MIKVSMKRLKEINLEDGKPTVSDALIILKSSINNAKSGNVGCLYIIHGLTVSDDEKRKQEVRPYSRIADSFKK